MVRLGSRPQTRRRRRSPHAPSALQRIRSWAAPANAYRLGRKTPCASTGRCADGDSPGRTCRVVSLLEKKLPAANIRVLLVPEVLGL